MREAGTLLKPPLKWAGGKRWLLPHLKPIWELHRRRRLVEPFCGGLAVSAGLLPDGAILNDINPHLINFYQWLKRGFVIEIFMDNEENCYYTYREQFNKLIKDGLGNTKQAAEFFYYLNRTGYNGLCRLNSSGEFNVPFGKYNQIKYMRDFTYYKELFAKWEFTAIDFEGLKLKKDDFVYADPPYDVEFTQYVQENFLWEDQERLVRWLSKHTGPVILSNQATPRIIDLYKKFKFELQFLPAPRRISCNGDRTPATEVLAIKGVFR